jgi:hypothetical protein
MLSFSTSRGDAGVELFRGKNKATKKRRVRRRINPDKATPTFLQLPYDGTTKTWGQSWKRFLVDFMYARRYFMLYPNLPDTRGLAYARQNNGVHVNRLNKDVYQVSLFTDSNQWEEVERGLPPASTDLKFIDLEHRRNSREIAMAWEQSC